MADPLPETPVRLQKYLAACGVGSRRACERLITEGRVTVDGQTATLGMSVVPGQSIVTVDGETVGVERKIYVLLYKPAGVVTSADDELGRRTVLDLVGDAGARVVPVGRLDKDVSGVLLLTNDGELTYRLTHPRFEVEKVYRARVKGAFSDTAKGRLARGVPLEDGKASPARATLVSRGPKSVVEIAVHEGRKHYVKRLLEAVGHPVEKLERIRFGPLTCEGMKPREWRHLTDEEIDALKRAAGLAPDQNAT